MSYQFAVVNYTSSDYGRVVTVPSVFGYFPLSNGTLLEVFLIHRSITVVGPNWSAESLAISSLTVHSLVSYNASRAAFLSSQKLAVMVNAPYGAVQLEFRWHVVEVEPNGTVYFGVWTVPSRTASSPYAPSILYPAPFVGTVGTIAPKVVIGSKAKVNLTGTVNKTEFRIVIEYTNGSNVRTKWINTSSFPSGVFSPGILVLNPNHWLAPANLILHVHDRCQALVHLFTFAAVYASSATLRFTVNPLGCGPIKVDGVSHSSGTKITLTPSGKAHNLSASACAGHPFLGWTSSGGVEVTQPLVTPSHFIVSASGNVTARYS